MGEGQMDFAWQGLEDKVYARVVQKVGSRRYWEDWAGDVARIAQTHITRIKTAVGGGGPVALTFERYLESLRATLNPAVREDEAIEMLAQHLITLPVFEALFGDSEFTRRNPVSEAMSAVLLALHEEEAIDKERAELADFYRSVRTRAEGIGSLEGRQKVVKDLYEIFFREAFPLTSDRLGIVYTPVEIVDFMLRSVGEILGQEFGTHLGAEGVHVLDPFSGTGTFIARLLAMLDPDDLERSYRGLVHANEIVLLAYYVAAVNIEQTYYALRGDGAYEPFTGIVLADTFQLGEGEGELMPEFLRPNSERARRQQSLPITVVLGNPPYSVGQGSQNDNNRNLMYHGLDERITATYAARSAAGLKRNLYDSYVRAFRWASDRVGDRGLVCFVANGGWIDSTSADGLRKTLVEEFAEIRCLNLRGAIRGRSGERAKREGGNPFGIMTGLAIVSLVRDPDHRGRARILYHDIGDYLSGDDKLARLASFGSMGAVPWQEITPNGAGDWINQRSELFEAFPPLGDKKSKDPEPLFDTYSLGVVTNRDAWAYNFSRSRLLTAMAATIDFYNDQREQFGAQVLQGGLRRTQEAVDGFVDNDPTRISWTRALKHDLRLNKPADLDPANAVPSMYRPFCKEWLYFDRQWNEMVLQMPSLFPTPEHPNRVIAVSGVGAGTGYSALMTEAIPCLHLAGAGNAVQCFPRYRYVAVAERDPPFRADGGYERHDAISPRTLDAYRTRFGAEVTADDVFYYVYGVLHSPEYRTRFAAELGKMLPRLPMVDAFTEFRDAGRRLAELHVGYESVDPWPLRGLPDASADPRELRVEKMHFGGGARTPDRSTIVVSPTVSLSGIPEEAHRYEVNGRTALEWLLDRYRVRVDQDSGITNDPNDWSDDPHYIVDLVARVVRVSVESAAIIDKLPALELPEP